MSEGVSKSPPLSTYRLQLQPGFGFDEAAACLDYLHDLGITHVYCSPYLRAEPGSTHGYNLVDPTRFNDELGGEPGFARFCEALRSRGMGHVLDFVPNHMGIGRDNERWEDVLENGRCARSADTFDIEWDPATEQLRGRVLLPVLGAQYGETLEKGELTLARRGGTFVVQYYERTWPLSPSSWGPLVDRALVAFEGAEDDPRRLELLSIRTALGHLPGTEESDPRRRSERDREKEIVKRRLAQVCEDAEVARAVDRAVADLDGDLLAKDALLMEQPYRLAYWRVATEEINYRRFFDVNDLAAVRMEVDEVWEYFHALPLRLWAEGHLDGLRLDHLDGIRDPAAYLEKLGTRLRQRSPEAHCWVVAEKILGRGEPLPAWEVDGTTGYDFLAQVGGVFVAPESAAAFDAIYRRTTGDGRSFAEHALEGKRLIMRASLSSEVNMLAQRLSRIAARDLHYRDFTRATLRRVIVETMAAFPVYRTYLREGAQASAEDRAHVARALRLAKRRNPEIDASCFAFLGEILLSPAEPGKSAEAVDFALRFQQATAPVMAKGVEDTAFYTYTRFVALNEVGGSPDRFGTTPEELHAANAVRARSFPRAMLATSTHDTKRGEDVRARLAVLSELPEEWEKWTAGFFEVAESYLTEVDEEMAPSREDQYAFFQTALGAYPLNGELDGFADRLAGYMVKTAREAKRRTSWLRPESGYEDALSHFARGMLGDPRFARELLAASTRIAVHGASNGLAMTLLKVASPGVPDQYQGSELWNLRLVDPDNRGVVDFEALRAAARSGKDASWESLRETFVDGRIKQRLLRAALAARRAHPDLFVGGDYEPLNVPRDVLAFARNAGGHRCVCAVTRFPFARTAGEARFAVGDRWKAGETLRTGPGVFRDLLTSSVHRVDGSGELPFANAFATLPLALLMREG